MVWCGVVWCGVVWCGVVWCGVVRCGVVWCGVVGWRNGGGGRGLNGVYDDLCHYLSDVTIRLTLIFPGIFLDSQRFVEEEGTEW